MTTATSRLPAYDLLCRLPLFAGVSHRDLEELCTILRVDRYDADTTISYQGDECDRVSL